MASCKSMHGKLCKTPSGHQLMKGACAPLQGHGRAVDWWALGVLLYEMMAGFPPFYDEEVTNTYKKIIAGHLSFPSHFPVPARDLIRKLLQVSYQM